MQHRPRVVVGARMVRVGILGEGDELARIIGPVAQRREVERAPHRSGLRRRLDASERIAISHTPPPWHIDLHVRGVQGT